MVRKNAKKSKGQNVPTLRETFIQLLQKPIYTFIGLCDELNVPPRTVTELIKDLSASGVKIVQNKNDQYFIGRDIAVDTPQDQEFDTKLKSGIHRIAILSDTHLGSWYQQLTFLRDFYKRAVDYGVTRFYHAGDVFAGNGRVYKGQEFEIFINGHDAAVEYAAEKYPKYEGCTTYFIAGNHDLSWYKAAGVDVGKFLTNARPDMVYLGQAGAFVNLTDSAKLYLAHPKGNVNYARSYKLQRYIENMAPESRPQIWVSGHLHTDLNMEYVGVEAFMVGCFEAQNTFLRSLGLYPCIGARILEIEIEGKEIRSIITRKIKYETPLVKDWD